MKSSHSLGCCSASSQRPHLPAVPPSTSCLLSNVRLISFFFSFFFRRRRRLGDKFTVISPGTSEPDARRPSLPDGEQRTKSLKAFFRRPNNRAERAAVLVINLLYWLNKTSRWKRVHCVFLPRPDARIRGIIEKFFFFFFLPWIVGESVLLSKQIKGKKLLGESN